MENSDAYIVGLDIGTTKIAAIVGRRNENQKIEILGTGKTESIGVNRGVVGNIEHTVNSIKVAVAEAEQKSGVGINFVNVGIAGQHIKSLQHRGTLIRENNEIEISQYDIDKLVNDMYNLNMNPGEEVIDVIPQDFIIDNEQGIKQPVGMLGNSLEANFHIIIGQTTAAKNIYKCVKKAGLEVVDLILEPIASASAVLSEEEKEAGVALVDIGGGTTDIAIFHDSIIRHTAVIPFGGDCITEDVKNGCTIIKKHAEELKVKFGSALADENKEEEIVAIPGLRGRAPKEITLKNLAHIIQARVEEILGQVHYEIRNSGYDKKLIAGVVLTGGGALLRHLPQLTEYITGMDVRIGYPNEHLAPENAKEITSPLYATGVGLVIEGLGRWEKDMLRNSKQIEEKVEEEIVEEIKSSKRTKKKKTDKKAPKEKRDRSTFLDRIQDWFEDGGE